MSEHLNHIVTRGMPSPLAITTMLNYVQTGTTEYLQLSLQSMNNSWANDTLAEFDELVHGNEALKQTIEGLKDGDIDLTNQAFVQNFMDGLKKAWGSMRNMLATAKSKESGYTEFKPKNLNKFVNNALSGKYGLMLDQPTSTPVGMNANYLKYANMVNEANLNFAGLADYVDSFRMKVGSLLSNQGQVNNPDAFDGTFFEAEAAKMLAFKESLKKFTNANDQTATKPFGELFANTNEFIETIQAVRTSTDNNNKVDRKAMMLNLSTLDTYFQELLKMAKNEGFSKKLMQSLAETTYVVGSVVEGFAAVTFIQRMLNAAMEVNVNEFGDFLN